MKHCEDSGQFRLTGIDTARQAWLGSIRPWAVSLSLSLCPIVALKGQKPQKKKNPIFFSLSRQKTGKKQKGSCMKERSFRRSKGRRTHFFPPLSSSLIRKTQGDFQGRAIFIVVLLWFHRGSPVVAKGFPAPFVVGPRRELPTIATVGTSLFCPVLRPQKVKSSNRKHRCPACQPRYRHSTILEASDLDLVPRYSLYTEGLIQNFLTKGPALPCTVEANIYFPKTKCCLVSEH